MKRFKNILLVHDQRASGQSTLDRAIALAEQNQASLTVIHVLKQLPRDYRMLVTAIPPKEIMEIVVREHTLLLEQYIARFTKGTGIRYKVVVGKEFVEIIKEVLRGNHDLVIKTARGMGGAIGMLFGTTAMHLLRKCPCPVWLMKPSQEQRIGRIMAAVDVVPPDGEENNLNNKIMELATSLAQTENSELHFVHAWEKPEVNLWGGGYYSGDIKNLQNDAKNMHAKWLDDYLGEYDLQHHNCHKHLLEGWAADVIITFAQQHQVDLIVMGTICRTGIPGFFIGNTAEKILHSIDCSVMAVKPEGFISPVVPDE